MADSGARNGDVLSADDGYEYARPYDWGAGRDASTTVCLALADAADVPVEDLGPLREVVDPEALDALFDSPRPTAPDGSLRVSFEYEGYAVTVTGDGTVRIRPPERAPDGN